MQHKQTVEYKVINQAKFLDEVRLAPDTHKVGDDMRNWEDYLNVKAREGWRVCVKDGAWIWFERDYDGQK